MTADHVIEPPDLVNEMTAALKFADGDVLVVDAATECMMVNTDIIQHAIIEGLPIVVVINKIDRLVTDPKLTPISGYRKLRHTLEAINDQIIAASPIADNVQLIDPIAGNVCFTSATAGWSFTLQSFSKIYCELHDKRIDPDAFASLLWEDMYYCENRVLKREPTAPFVQFVLEMLQEIVKRGTINKLDDENSMGTAYSTLSESASDFIDKLVKRDEQKMVEDFRKIGKSSHAIMKEHEELDGKAEDEVFIFSDLPKIEMCYKNSKKTNKKIIITVRELRTLV